MGSWGFLHGDHVTIALGLKARGFLAPYAWHVRRCRGRNHSPLWRGVECEMVCVLVACCSRRVVLAGGAQAIV